MKSHEGGCLCGALRYRITGAVDDIVHCHCHLCRRSSGALMMTWVTVARADFAWISGSPARYRSSDHGERCFCPTCGTELTLSTTRHPNEVDVTLGSFDHPELHRANRHVWTSARLPGLHLDDNLPDHPEETS